MASFPWWTEAEWLLLIELFDREGPRPPPEAIETLSDALRALGALSERPDTRRLAAHRSYRSRDAVWTQFDEVVALAEGRPRRAPRRLTEVWQRYQERPEHVREFAAPLWQLLEVERKPHERESLRNGPDVLQRFLRDLHRLLQDIVDDGERVLPPESRSELAAAWGDIQESRVIDTAVDELDGPRLEGPLRGVGLTGAQLDFKLNPFRRAYDQWSRQRALASLRRALRWANVVLGSLSKVIVGLDALKEFKEGTETALEEGPAGPPLLEPALA